MGKKKSGKIEDLTWADLEEWAGSKIVSRGMSYQRSNLVRDLAKTDDDSLIAWVRGSSSYATLVSFEKGRLSSDCSCPYGSTCKHAVAVVLEYLERCKNDKKIPQAKKDDERLLLLDGSSGDWDDEDEYDEYNDYGDDLIDEAEEALSKIDSDLGKKSKRELQSMLSKVIAKHPEVEKELGLSAGKSRAKGSDDLVKSVRKAIIRSSSERGWRNYWQHEGYTPDYSTVREGLERLLDEGRADDVIQLGDYLFERGIAQVEESDDEGETLNQIAEAMAIVIKALPRSSLTDVDKLEWAVNYALRDNYDMCPGIDNFMNRRFSKKTWSELADRLLVNLRNLKPEKMDGTFSRHYKREIRSAQVINALDSAGREDESIALCVKEAEENDSYERLVKKLRSCGRTAEAEEWIRKGMKATIEKWPGIASSLKDQLIEIRRQKRDWPFVAALLADDFLAGPGLESFKKLKPFAERAAVWPEVRKACLWFLENGESPARKSGWPLPETDLPKNKTRHHGQPPFTECLIDIAIYEKRIDDVVRWHEVAKKSKNRFGRQRDREVAEAIVHEYPEKAVAIWKDIAEKLIAQTNVNIYGEAVAYLRKVQVTLEQLKRASEWDSYFNMLSEKHKRKSRFMQMLNVLSRKKILST